MGKITTKEAAEHLGVTIRRVNALIASGQLPAEKFGTLNMIDEADLKLVANRKPGRPAAKKAKKGKTRG